MKKLKFKGFKVQWILNGSKTATMRLFDDKNLQVGDKLELINSDNNEIFAYGEIMEIISKPLGEVNNTDLNGHEKWANKTAMMENLSLYYAEQIDDSVLVKIIRFSLIDNC
ncbi:MAG: ASCH domain-containing protein [Patescibacteria group bacterium]|nr:ASCH domain-containing protein [Patescibacteria group bacterium]